MSEEKCCCNCLHCARWKRKHGIECHCDINDEYLGYLEVMDTDKNCRNWEKETKWDLEKEHEKKIREDERAKTIDEVYEILKKEYYYGFRTPSDSKQRLVDMIVNGFFNKLNELKNRNNGRGE